MRACSAQVRDAEIQVWEWVRWVECSDGSEQNRLRGATRGQHHQHVNLNLFIAETREPKKQNKKTPHLWCKSK